ncbi:hypothetical protein OJ996_10200 [Luteolibacter sp. GHJ8]|uniref:PEP-CTERM sorting domain-containing protein n=1 Tax=Luteolibacter rhizosphaerae TaxID=2989719 RepID=A0ABT3G291_9BACT|nr:hypothetical protein [Luteolibacter rhizosphaerae]MCW1913948.1 hypothetical protein [Luteolibacter rhizosphaerae]
MNLPALSAFAVVAFALPVFSQSMTWETTGPSQDREFGNNLVFANGGQGFSATSWSHTGGRRNQSFEAALGVIYPTGVGVTNPGEGMRVPEHQIDNGRGNDWVLLIFEGPVSDVTLTLDPYGTWDRDVTYYTANLDGAVDLSGLSYEDLASLGFDQRVDDLSNRSNEDREIEINPESGTFNAILIGAFQDRPRGPRDIDRFKITGVNTLFTVPEPSTTMLGVMGAAMLLRRRRAK